MKTKVPYVYIVDDDVVSLKVLLNKIRSSANCNVRTFTSAEECLRISKVRMPDLILADYYLDIGFNKQMNGDDLLQEVRKISPDVPVIMYSSTESLRVIVQIIKDGAQDFIPRDKNFIEDITAATINQINMLHPHEGLEKRIRSLLTFAFLTVTLFLVVDHYFRHWSVAVTTVTLILFGMLWFIVKTVPRSA